MNSLFKSALICAIIVLNINNSLARKRVGITQIVEHPSLNKIREGIIETLRKPYGEDLEIVYENAQGNVTTATQIAQKFAGMELDIIIPITTPSAQAVINNVSKTPIVFSAVSDPLEAKIVDSVEHPGGNKTGVMDLPPLERQVDFMLSLFPDLKTLGVPYNPGEANSVAMLKDLEKIASQKGVVLTKSPVTKSADVGIAAQALVGRVDAIFIGTDNTVVSGLEALIKVCMNNHIPLFASDPDSVKRGAYAALAYDQKGIGNKTGELVVRVLEGENPGNIPVAIPEKISVSFNKVTADHLGLPQQKENPG